MADPKAALKVKSGSTLDEHEKTVHVAEIVHHGDKVIIPEGMSLDDTIDLLARRKDFLEEDVILRKTFNVFPWDGGNALDVVLTRKYGWAPAKATPGFFGKNPPQLITIEIAPGETKQIPWGRFQLPQISGFVQCSTNQKEGRMVFEMVASILRKDEQTIQDLFKELEQELKVNSIYSGKAFKMRFRDDDGDVLEMPEPSFINTSDVDESMLVFPEAIQKAIETNLFTPIKRVADCKANGIPVKRGVLLGGTYGTGKTMAAKVASKLAVAAGVTYLYVPRADELADAVSFAKLYQDPACVIFCEDIDRVMDGERTESMDDILNIIDGIDTKNSNILVVLTTNDLNGINPAMLRPGRLDAVIDVLPPDPAAVEKLIRIYGGSAISKDTDLSGIRDKLAGRIPAVIAEVVKRAKLSQLSLQEEGTMVTSLTSEALEEAADTMQAQLDLLYKEKKVTVPTVDNILRAIVEDVMDGKGMPKKVDALHEHFLE